MKTMNDEELARQLQQEYDREAGEQLIDEVEPNQRGTSNSTFVQTKGQNGYFHGTFSNVSPVDPSLEFTDPNPDIRLLFLQFNQEFFWGKLSGIEVKWSPRMTLCAGVCVYEGHGGLCSVRLSQPLLKLRPRKDLVETLLHEMIHAFLFITNNDRDRDGHGPNFQKHMRRINQITGASISIYHTFHDEVGSYQQHWWRCNGPCQNRKPYFGYVKRAMNRAPSSNDFWWAEHRATCGGTYTKVKEPENYGKPKAGSKKGIDGKKGERDIRQLINKAVTSSPSKKNKNVHGLFDTTGKVNLKSGSIVSNGDINSSTKGNSALKTVVSGGILIPKTSSKQNSLFTSITSAASTSSITSPSSPRRKSNKASTNGTISNPVKIDDIFPRSGSQSGSGTSTNNRSGGDGGGGFNRKNSDFGNHRGSGNSHLKDSPLLNRKGTLFKKDFTSICVHTKDGVSSKKGKGRQKKKYVFDELDSDDGLWDSPSKTRKKSDSNGWRKSIISSDGLPSISPLNKTLTDICKIPDQESSPEKSHVKRDILRELTFHDVDNSSCHRDEQYSNVYTPKDDRFPGDGIRLGAGSSNKSSVQSKSQVSLSGLNNHNSLKDKNSSDKKRSFEVAFEHSVIGQSNFNADITEPSRNQQSKKQREGTGANSSSNFTAMATEEEDDDDDLLLAASEDNLVSNKVPCPVCNCKISHDSINSHLDQCLQMD